MWKRPALACSAIRPSPVRSQREADARLRRGASTLRKPAARPGSVCSTRPLAGVAGVRHVGADVDLVEHLPRHRIDRDARAVDERRLVEPRRVLPRCNVAGSKFDDLLVGPPVRRVDEEAQAVVDGQPRRRLPRVLRVPLRPDLLVVRLAVAAGLACTAGRRRAPRSRYAKLVLSGLLALLLNWNCPIHVPPRASLFVMYSKWPPNLSV